MANGKTQIILVCSERKINVGCKLSLYDKNWNFIPEKLAGAHSRDEVSEIKKPVTFNQMIEAAEILAKDFPQVRVDFYEVNGKLFFGEMTFTSQGGYMNYIHPDELTRIGKLITLPIQ